MRRALLLCLLLGLPVAPRAQPVRTASPRALFRHYALSTCLARALPKIAPEAEASARGYFELGTGTPDVYRQVQTLADAYLKRPYPSQTGADLSVMKCIDFAESPELAHLVARSIPEHRP